MKSILQWYEFRSRNTSVCKNASLFKHLLDQEQHIKTIHFHTTIIKRNLLYSVLPYTCFSLVSRRLYIFSSTSCESGTTTLGLHMIFHFCTNVKLFWASECRMYEQIVLPNAAGTHATSNKHTRQTINWNTTVTHGTGRRFWSFRSGLSSLIHHILFTCLLISPFKSRDVSTRTFIEW